MYSKAKVIFPQLVSVVLVVFLVGEGGFQLRQWPQSALSFFYLMYILIYICISHTSLGFMFSFTYSRNIKSRKCSSQGSQRSPCKPFHHCLCTHIAVGGGHESTLGGVAACVVLRMWNLLAQIEKLKDSTFSTSSSMVNFSSCLLNIKTFDWALGSMNLSLPLLFITCFHCIFVKVCNNGAV